MVFGAAVDDGAGPGGFGAQDAINNNRDPMKKVLLI